MKPAEGREREASRRMTSLHYRRLGETGSTVAFLPGLGLTTRYWESRVAPLAETHRLLLLDLLGFGQSPKPWITYSVDRHVKALHDVLGAEPSLTLVGHSLGSLLAVAYAARHPEHVTGLIALGLPRFQGEAEAKQFLRSRSALDRWVLTNTVVAGIACVLTRHVARRLLPRLLHGMPPDVVEDYVQHTWRSATSTVREVVYRYDVCADAARLPPQMPMLLLHGGRDRTAPLANARELARRHASWKFVELPEGDHHLLLNDPGWCVAQIAAFLDAQETNLNSVDRNPPWTTASPSFKPTCA